MAEFGPVDVDTWLATLSPKSARIEVLGRTVEEMTEQQTAPAIRLAELSAIVESQAGAAGPSGSQQLNLQQRKHLPNPMKTLSKKRTRTMSPLRRIVPA